MSPSGPPIAPSAAPAQKPATDQPGGSSSADAPMIARPVPRITSDPKIGRPGRREIPPPISRLVARLVAPYDAQTSPSVPRLSGPEPTISGNARNIDTHQTALTGPIVSRTNRSTGWVAIARNPRTTLAG